MEAVPASMTLPGCVCVCVCHASSVPAATFPLTLQLSTDRHQEPSGLYLASAFSCFCLFDSSIDQLALQDVICRHQCLHPLTSSVWLWWRGGVLGWQSDPSLGVKGFICFTIFLKKQWFCAWMQCFICVYHLNVDYFKELEFIMTLSLYGARAYCCIFTYLC